MLKKDPTSLVWFLLLSSFFTITASQDCYLKCQNGGKCMPGRPVASSDTTTLKEYLDNADSQQTAYMGDSYCSCPTGYAGAFCEIAYKVCEKAGDKCFSGQNCTRDIDSQGEPYYHCECDVQKTDFSSPYVVRMCGHASTMFCKPPDEYGSVSAAGSSFCANSGKCKPAQEKMHHPGCVCTPDWSGENCQNPVGVTIGEYDATKYFDEKALAAQARQASSGGRRRRAFLSMLSLVMLVGGVGLLVYHGSRRRTPRRQRLPASPPEQEMTSPSRRYRDQA